MQCIAVRCGVVWCGAVRCGAVQCAIFRNFCGAVRCGSGGSAVRCGAVRHFTAPPTSLAALDRKIGPKSDLKISNFRNFELDPQIIYHSIELIKLSNFCEDTSEKFPSLRAPDKKNRKSYFTFGNFYLENFRK